MTKHATSRSPMQRQPPLPPGPTDLTADLAADPATDATARARVFDLEAQRLRAALRGQPGAFAALVRPHLPMLLRVAARAAHNPALAEDAVQEGLEIAAQRLARYRAGTSMRAWLASIVSKRAFTLARSERRRRLREDVAEPPERSPDPRAEAVAAQMARRVQRALETLPEKRRRAVVLRLDGGLGYDEIAAAIGSTPASARVLVHLGLKTLRAALAEAEGARGEVER